VFPWLEHRKLSRPRVLERLALLVLLLAVVAAPVVAHAASVYVEWRDPWHVYNISILAAPAGRSDDPHGPYLVSGGTRFRHWVYAPLWSIIKFLDIRIRDPDFPEGYRGLWLLQGGYWRTGKDGYCWWARVRFVSNNRSAVIINMKRIGVAEGFAAAYAVLSYGSEPRPLDAPIGSLIVVPDTSMQITLVNMVGGRIGAVTLLVCGPPGYRIHFRVFEGTYWHGYTSHYDVYLKLPGEPAGHVGVDRPSAPMPEGNTLLLLGAGAVVLLVVAVAVILSRG